MFKITNPKQNIVLDLGISALNLLGFVIWNLVITNVCSFHRLRQLGVGGEV